MLVMITWLLQKSLHFTNGAIANLSQRLSFFLLQDSLLAMSGTQVPPSSKPQEVTKSKQSIKGISLSTVQGHHSPNIKQNLQQQYRTKNCLPQILPFFSSGGHITLGACRNIWPRVHYASFILIFFLFFFSILFHFDIWSPQRRMLQNVISNIVTQLLKIRVVPSRELVNRLLVVYFAFMCVRVIN